MKIEDQELPNLITYMTHHIRNENIATFLHEWEDPIFAILIGGFISLLFFIGSFKKKLIPGGFQNFLEFFAEMLDKTVVEIIGPGGRRFVPFIGTLFIYILFLNWAGLVPLMHSPSSSLSTTLGLALCVFMLVQYLNFKNMGIKGFLYHLAGSPKGALGFAMIPLMLPIEIITHVARPFTLSMRLCGNILGEDIFIAFATIFGVSIVSNHLIPFGLPLQLPFMLLGVFTGFIQALVFTLLTTVYILLTIPDAEEEHPH